jgi:hypothetical protein
VTCNAAVSAARFWQNNPARIRPIDGFSPLTIRPPLRTLIILALWHAQEVPMSIPFALLAEEGTGWLGHWASIWAILLLLIFVFWILTLIDCINSNLPRREKVVWFGVILLLPPIGSLIYLFFRRSGGRRGTVV